MKISTNSLLAICLAMVHMTAFFQQFQYIWLAPLILLAAILYVSYQKPRWFRIYIEKREPNGTWGLTMLSVILLLSYRFSSPWYELLVSFVSLWVIEYCRFAWKKSHLDWYDKLRTKHTTVEQTDQVLLDLRRERHDYLKHITSLQYMLEQGEYQEATQYMGRLVGEFERFSASLSGEKSAIAGLLHWHSREAEKANIELIYEFEVPVSTLPMPQEEIVVLLGNALSNALEAAERYKEEEGEAGHVMVKLQKKSAFYILIIRNDTTPVPDDVLDKLYRVPSTTTKTGERGFGATSIQSIVQKRHGHLDFTYKQKHYTLKIKWPSIQID
ncbi:histidine kinase [Pontibacillus chungwhensis BH030062]|uniref:Histidine kinase n=1 Tax=Pontibacillus chungwhensis BH030062 TaxID=1385513 RepID=A0A0A2V0K7_9BACI|nr:GHKL domain-containing protein [Pontibacillus chungwhensis]KGP92563.1 histidine kinase [Pontibacillus chungwhensis BH030062]